MAGNKVIIINSEMVIMVPIGAMEPGSVVSTIIRCVLYLFLLHKANVLDMESPLPPAGLFMCSLVSELSSSSCLCLAASEQGQETPAACVSYPDNVSLNSFLCSPFWGDAICYS